MKKSLKKPLHILIFVVILAFLLYLIPPVRQFVDRNLLAQVSELVQLEICYDSCDPNADVCFGNFVPVGTCSTSTSATEFAGELGTDTAILTAEELEAGLAETPSRDVLNSTFRIDGGPSFDILETSLDPSFDDPSQPSIPGFEDLSGSAQELIQDGEVIVDVDTVDGFAAFKALVISNIGTVIEFSPGLSDPNEIYAQLIEFLGLSLPTSESVDAILKQCITDYLIQTYGLPEAIQDGVVVVDFSEETSIGYAALKAAVNEVLDANLNQGSFPPEGPNPEAELEGLIQDLGLSSPVDAEVLEFLMECLANRIIELFPDPTEGLVTGGNIGVDLTDPESEEYKALKLEIDSILNGLIGSPDPARGIDKEGTLQDLIRILGLTQPLEADVLAFLQKCIDEKVGTLFPDNVIIGGEVINIAVEAGRIRAKELILQGIRGALFSPDFINLIKTIMELQEGSPGLDDLINGCLQLIYDLLGNGLDGGGNGQPVDPLGPQGPFVPWDPDDPWWPWDPHGGDPPPDDPPPPEDPPPEDPLCPQCPIKYLWDTPAYHDGGVPIHATEDAPYFFVGSDVVIYPSMQWKRIEEPVLWLGNAGGGVDGQLTPNAADTDNMAVDANGMIVNKSSRQSLTVQTHHITGDTFNAGQLGTLIVSRYKKVGPQQYEFFVIEVLTITKNGEHTVGVFNDPLRTPPDLLEGEGIIRLIYMEPSESSNLFANEDIENAWDGRRSTLWDIINFPGEEPIDLHGEVEDWWYGDDCSGNFIIVNTRSIPSCNQRQTVEVLNEPNTAGGLNITFVCEQSQSQTCGTPINPGGGAGNFGGGAGSPTNNQPFADYSVGLIDAFNQAGNPNDPKIRLELMYQFTVGALSAIGNNPTP